MFHDIVLRERVDLSQGLCVGHPDPDLWFREEDEWRAAQICHQCPVQLECVTASYLNSEERGVWGGLSAEVRQVPHRYLRPQRSGASTRPSPSQRRAS